MEEKPRPRLILDAIIDKNLYGRSFTSMSLPYLIVGLVIQYFIFYLLIPEWLIIYAFFYVGLVIIAGAFTKNIKREFHPMTYWLAYLLFLTSALSKAFAIIAPFESTMLGFMKRLLIVSISEPAFLVSIITIAVFGQRTSLRKNVGLDDKFFDKEKDRWKRESEGFPNLDKIVASLSSGRFVASLFDKGLFNLTTLQACNVMGEVIDLIADEIINRNPEKRRLFRKKSGLQLYYPSQIRSLGYNFHRKCHALWQVRNKIAHENYKPTFEETNEAMTILVSFTQETPTILKKWISPRT